MVGKFPEMPFILCLWMRCHDTDYAYHLSTFRGDKGVDRLSVYFQGSNP